MADLEERVATLETQTNKLTLAVENLRTDIADLRVELRTEISALRVELRTDVAAIRTDMAGMARRSETDELRRELALVRSEMATRSDLADLRCDMNRFFLWLAGTQVATLLAVVGVLAGILFR